VSSPLGTPSQRRRKPSAARRRPGSRGPSTQSEADSDAATVVTATVKSVRGRLGRCDGRRDGDRHRDLALRRHRDLALRRHRDLALRRHRDLALRRHRDLALRRHRDLALRRHRDLALRRHRDLALRRHRDLALRRQRGERNNDARAQQSLIVGLPAVGSPPLILPFYRRSEPQWERPSQSPML
jgi:hypothetical protein